MNKSQSYHRKVKSIEQLLLALKEERKQGREIVFTNGCFDILHIGHVRYLKQARSKGDLLVVGVNTDRSVREAKGSGRPVQNEQDRSEVLSALDSVDYIVLFDEPTPKELVEKIAPDVIIKGDDWREKGVVGSEFVLEHGGRVELAPLVDGASTTDIIKRIVERFGDS